MDMKKHFVRLKRLATGNHLNAKFRDGLQQRCKEEYRQIISLVKIKASFMCSWIKQVVGNS